MNTISTERLEELENDLIADIVSLIRAAWVLCDNTANEDPPEVDQQDWDALSKALDKLELLPDPPDVLAGPATKTEFALRTLLSRRSAVDGKAERMRCTTCGGETFVRVGENLHNCTDCGGTGYAHPPAPSHGAPTHRHKKRRTDYVLIGIGKMQAERWRGLSSVEDIGFLTSVDMREVAIYRSVDDGSLWVRPREEFEDGRFEALPAPTPVHKPGHIDPASGQYVGPFTQCVCGNTELERRGDFWRCTQCGTSWLASAHELTAALSTGDGREGE